MRASTWVCVAIALAGCHRKPRPKDPATTPIGNGQFMITTTTAKGEAAAYRRAYTEANSMCPGGYEVVDSRLGSSKGSRTRCGNVFGTIHCKSDEDAQDLILVVRCSASPPADDEPEPDPDQPPEPDEK